MVELADLKRGRVTFNIFHTKISFFQRAAGLYLFERAI